MCPAAEPFNIPSLVSAPTLAKSPNRLDATADPKNKSSYVYQYVIVDLSGPISWRHAAFIWAVRVVRTPPMKPLKLRTVTSRSQLRPPPLSAYPKLSWTTPWFLGSQVSSRIG